MRTYTYMLFDNDGSSNAENQELLIPIGTEFIHEFGLYKVIEYRDRRLNQTSVTSKIVNVVCDRLKTNQELKIIEQCKNIQTKKF